MLWIGLFCNSHKATYLSGMAKPQEEMIEVVGPAYKDAEGFTKSAISFPPDP